MGRYVTKEIPKLLQDLDDTNFTGLINSQSLTYDSLQGKWVNGDLLEEIANKSIANGYAGLDANGDLDLGTF